MYYQRIRDMREDNDKTQAEIAMVLGITRSQYHLYESGKREIPVHHL
ncbi:MAG: helix-turn-helix transcriptional regulator, partial [Clostridia bacterium]|nr:helix-turn-helix transcriptional regulator [Clostridia bacterium]